MKGTRNRKVGDNDGMKGDGNTKTSVFDIIKSTRESVVLKFGRVLYRYFLNFSFSMPFLLVFFRKVAYNNR